MTNERGSPPSAVPFGSARGSGAHARLPSLPTDARRRMKGRAARRPDRAAAGAVAVAGPGPPFDRTTRAFRVLARAAKRECAVCAV